MQHSFYCSTGNITKSIGLVIPSFIFVGILNPMVPRLRKSNFFSKFLDAVNVSALAVMLVVAIKLGGEVLTDWRSWAIAFLSLTALISIKKINVAYVILGGAVTGYLFYLI